MGHSESLSGVEKLMRAIDRSDPVIAEGNYIDPATGEQLPNRIDAITCSRVSGTNLLQNNNALTIFPNFGNR